MTKQNYVLVSSLSKGQIKKALKLIAIYCNGNNYNNLTIDCNVIRFTYRHSMKAVVLRNYGKGYFLVDKSTYSTII